MLTEHFFEPVEARQNPLPEDKETVIFDEVALTGMSPDTLPVSIYTGFEWVSEFELILYMDLYVSFREASDVLPGLWDEQAVNDDSAMSMFLWWQSQDTAGLDGYYEFSQVNWDAHTNINFSTHDASYKLDNPAGAADLFPDNLVFSQSMSQFSVIDTANESSEDHWSLQYDGTSLDTGKQMQARLRKTVSRRAEYYWSTHNILEVKFGLVVESD